MDEPSRPSWAPLAFVAGVVAICCSVLPVLALAVLGVGGAAAWLTGALWIAVGGGAIAAILATLYVVRRRR